MPPTAASLGRAFPATGATYGLRYLELTLGEPVNPTSVRDAPLAFIVMWLAAE